VNILTKIFIVLMVPLTIIAGIVFSAQAVIHPSYRNLYETEKAKNAARQAQLAERGVALATANSNVSDLSENLATARADFEATNQALRLDNERLESQLARTQTDLATLTVDVSNLRVDLERLEESRQLLSDQRDDLVEAVGERDAELASLSGVLRELEQDNDTQERLIRVLREQIAELEDQLELYSDLPTNQAGEINAQPVAPQPTAVIRGSVRAVDLNNNLVTINVGTIQGVRREMEFFIYRGDQYIAKVRIVEVADGEASGLLFDRRNGLSPVAGDSVATSMR
jgi:predicted nuclease with TOPRIM domain